MTIVKNNESSENVGGTGKFEGCIKFHRLLKISGQFDTSLEFPIRMLISIVTNRVPPRC